MTQARLITSFTNLISPAKMSPRAFISASRCSACGCGGLATAPPSASAQIPSDQDAAWMHCRKVHASCALHYLNRNICKKLGRARLIPFQASSISQDEQLYVQLRPHQQRLKGSCL